MHAGTKLFSHGPYLEKKLLGSWRTYVIAEETLPPHCKMSSDSTSKIVVLK